MRLPLILTMTCRAGPFGLRGPEPRHGARADAAAAGDAVAGCGDPQSSARVVVNREMAKRLPGANVAPYTDCVLQNATTAELASIADAGAAGAGNAVASIVGRPATSQCIAGAAAAAKGHA
jgi:hypothetical protein